MNSQFDLGVGPFSYSNPNYQLVPQDENCNVENSYEDLYEELGIAPGANRKSGVCGRRKYASLEPSSMGVDLETEPMLTGNIENNLKETLSGNDNGNSVFDSNKNKDMVKRSNFLDYYISLKAATQKEKNDLPNSCEDGNCKENTCPSSASEKSPESSKCDEFSSDETGDNAYLPTGWEKHEDESGPYYWHISSGTIQRDPPLSHLLINKLSKESLRDFETSSKYDSDVNTSKAFRASNVPNCLQTNNVLSAQDKLKRKSCPDGNHLMTVDKRPIRFAVRSLGWVEIDENDLTPERSSKAVNKCIIDLSCGKNDILDVVGRWGDGKDLFMDLDDYSLRLMNTPDLTILNTQPIHTIRVWGVGRDNGRDFAYVARDRVTKKYMCHVFRCDIPARIIANTLRDICKKIMIERSLQKCLSKHDPSLLSSNTEINDSALKAPARPTDLPMNRGLFPSSESQGSNTAELFPTPMEEPRKVMRVYYLGSTNVDAATGVDVLNNAIEKLMTSVPKSQYKYVNVAVAPSTVTVSEHKEDGKQLAECRVRFLSFLGIGKNVKTCGFIVHTALHEFVAHVFYCEPSSGALCKTIEAACKLRYQKCLDAHKKDSDINSSETRRKNIKAALKNAFGTFFQTRLHKSAET